MKDATSNDFSYQLWRYNKSAGELIPLLQSAQQQFGYVPEHAITHISEITGIPTSKIYGVITFYKQFRLSPMGKHVIRVCVGTACHVSKASMVVETLRDILGIDVDETSKDNLFSLFTVSCLGCCSLAPVMTINDVTYGGLTPDKIKKIIKRIQNEHQHHEIQP